MQFLYNYQVILLVIIIIIVYYLLIFWYSNKIKKSKYTKNINNNLLVNENISIFDKNYEVNNVLSIKKVVKVDDNSNRKKDWRNELDAINNQSLEIENTNVFQTVINNDDKDFKNPSLN